jgi:hypothetical protein
MTESVFRTAKSFAVLSVRVRSSGISPPAIPHNSRNTISCVTNLPVLFRLRIIL